ncbi:MAG: tRNA pseudouridine(38-40) synthase TruA [Deltaproteobacteria bacterium]|nr:tRNA pseudouridine(38-40) synthase TruA [Deltaproteobacteria bacterium]MBW1954513.1 tRNA pseudouridine(38-40) synthase TruA [Deltaproteobacteria bacterium]MBW2041727.1 tRNA pseudouridine(38-40) synthase TruA [Deltaproteobacteria bacterium]MBW2131032.1 tRNA pseudouridine(38-40) synthase TruA [Deltaproteobacteria bacterium]
MPNFKLLIEYDGTAYHGWQRQKHHPTVQGEIEAVLETMTGQKATVIGSGRTDAGVHALGQVAHFHSKTRLSPKTLLSGLNSLLPEDIVIHRVVKVKKDFHARYHARAKTYQYRILNRPIRGAIGRNYAWHVRKPLDVAAMRSAAACLLGTHDFKSFEGAGSPRSHTRRTLTKATISKAPGGFIVFEFRADGFLKAMVRNMVGTLVSVGLKKRRPEEVNQILLSKDRRLAGSTAPSRGLILKRVTY